MKLSQFFVAAAATDSISPAEKRMLAQVVQMNHDGVHINGLVNHIQNHVGSLLSCQGGHHHDHHHSVKTEVVCSCPDGYVQNGNICDRVVESELEPICPVGYALFNDQCINSVVASVKCPENFSKIGGTCVKKNTTLPVPTCEEGWELVKKNDRSVCQSTKPVQNTLTCPEGSITKGGKCFEVSRVEGVYVCEEGFTLVGEKTCQKTVVVEGDDQVGHHHSHKAFAHPVVQALHHNKRFLAETVNTETNLADIHGAIGSLFGHSKPGLVQKRDNEPLSPEQAVGYAPLGPLGHVQHTHTPEKETVSVSIQKTYTATVTRPAKIECPAGATPVLDGCMVYTPVDAVPVCPSGSTEVGGICTSTAYKMPLMECPTGYAQNCITNQHRHSLECECQQVEMTSLVSYCPSDSWELEDNLCVIYIEPTFGCTNGDIRDGDVCQTYSAVPATCEVKECECTFPPTESTPSPDMNIA